MKSSRTQSEIHRDAPIYRGINAKIPSRFSGQVLTFEKQIIWYPIYY
jgi:hypothetical protein